MAARSAISRQHISPPQDETEFEVALIDVANHIFDSDDFYRIGKRGTNQHGGDLKGHQDKDLNELIIIQAKCREPGKKEPVDDLRSDATRAIAYYKPKLFIYATTAQTNEALEAEVDKLNEAQRFKPLEEQCQVRLWSWNTLSDLAARDETVLRALSPTEAVALRIAGQFDKETQGAHPIEAAARSSLTPARSKITTIILETGEPDEERTPLSESITLASDLVKTDPRQAIEKFKHLSEETNLEPVDRCRIAGGLGNCFLALGDMDQAAKHYEDAYAIMPDRSATVANHVIGLHHQGNLDTLRDVAERGMKAYPLNKVLAMRAAYFLDDPDFLTPEVRTTEEGWVARLEISRRHDAPMETRKLSRKALKKHPGARRLRQFRADFLLEQVLTEPAAMGMQALSAKGAEDLEDALNLYKDLWEDRKHTSDHQEQQDVSLPTNYMQGLRIKGDHDEACRVGQYTWDRPFHDPSIAQELSINRIRAGEFHRLGDYIEHLPHSKDGYGLRLQYALQQEDWDRVKEIAQTRIAGGDIGIYPGMLELADRQQQDKDHQIKALQALADNPDDASVRHWIMRAQHARVIGEIAIAQALLDIGFDQLGSAPDAEALMSVVAEANALDDHDKVLTLLKDKIDYSRPSVELRYLVEAAASEFPAQKRSAEVFERLDATFLDDGMFRQAAAVGAFNRRHYATAAEHFSALLDQEPHLRHVVNCLITSHRLRDEAMIQRLLGRNDLWSLRHSPDDDIKLAWILNQNDHAEAGIRHAYRAISTEIGQNDAQISGSFVVYVLQTPPLERDRDPNTVLVETGRYVRLKRSGTDQVTEGIIDADGNQPWGRRLGSDDPRIRRAIGLKMGDTFTTPGSQGEVFEWKIEEVLPDYVRAARFLMSEHEDRFGPEAIIFRLTIQDNNLDPLLERVKADGQQVDQMVQQTINNALPLAFMGEGGGAGALKMAGSIRARNLSLRTNKGTLEELDQSSNLIEDSGPGLAIDLFTAVTAYNIGFLQTLAEHFGPLYLSTNELESLLALNEMQPASGAIGSLSAINGQIFKDVSDAEETDVRRQSFEHLIEALRTHCTIEPVIYDLSGHEIEDIIFSMKADVLAPLQLARKHNVPLLSDDQALRDLGAQIGLDRGVWLSAIINVLGQKDRILADTERFFLAGLIELRHEQVAISTRALAKALELRDRSNQDEQIANLLMGQIGGNAADIGSHSTVFLRAIKQVAEVANTETSVDWAIEQFGDRIQEEKSDARLRLWLKTVLRLSDYDTFDKIAGVNSRQIRRQIMASYLRAEHFLLSCSHAAMMTHVNMFQRN